MTDGTDIDWDALAEAVVAAALDVLAAGPRTLDELTGELRERGVLGALDGGDWDLAEIVDECLLDDERTLDFADGRIAIIDQVIDGVTLTHRVSADELARGVLDVHPDLHGLMWGAEERALAGIDGVVTTEYPFDGNPRFHEHGSYVGPDGWLSGVEPGALIALRYHDQVIEVLAGVDPTADPAEAADALRRANDLARSRGHELDADLLVLEAAHTDPTAFRAPTLPVGELFPLAGLRHDGAWVRRAGEPSRRARRRPAVGGIDELRIRHGLDDCCVAELRRLVETYLAWVAAGTDGRSEVAATWRADQLHASADHGAVGTAFADFITVTSAGARETVDEFGAAIAAAGRELEPFAHHILAVSALTDGDAAGALAALEATVELGGTYAPALDLAAVLLADAGRPVEALAVRRRATSLGWPPVDTAQLQTVLRQTGKTGRNDPCPCGSGRKYKQCCQRDPKLTTADRRRLALHQMVRYAVHGDGRDELMSLAITVLTEIRRPGGPPADALGRIMLDPLMIDIATFETGRAAEYLQQRGGIIPVAERAWLEQLVDTRRGLWSSERQPDGSFRVREVMTGEQFDDARFANGAGPEPGEYVLARIMADGLDGVPGPIGPLLQLDRARSRSVIELIDGFADADAWARWVGRRASGDRDEDAGAASPGLSHAHFALPEGGWDAARAVLDAHFTADGPGWIQFVEFDDMRLVRAGLAPDGDELVVSANSLRRLDDIRQILAPAGFRLVRTEVPEPDNEEGWYDDDIDDEWDDEYDDEWDDDADDWDDDDEMGDVDLSAIDAMFEAGKPIGEE